MKDQVPFFYNWRSIKNKADGAQVNACCASGELDGRCEPEIESVYDLFKFGLQRNPLNPCLSWRNGQCYRYFDYQTVDNHVQKLGKALRCHGIKPEDFVGIYSCNSSQWMTTAFACASNSFVLVPLYDTLGADSCLHIMKEVAMQILFVDTVQACRKIIDTLDENEDLDDSVKLRTIVILGSIGHFKPENIPNDLQTKAKSMDITISSVQDFSKVSADNVPEARNAKYDDLYMVQYTSGTTGTPKGVMLTHGNLVANCAAVRTLYIHGAPRGYSLDDCGPLRTLHYLPLAHSYGQLVALAFLYMGGQVGFFSGNVTKLVEDAQILQPTWMPLVPRLMNKVYSKVIAEMDSKGSLAKKVFWFCYRKKLQMFKKGIITTNSIYDKLVFNKIQQKLGGRVKMMLTASAPVSEEVLEFWRIVFGTHVSFPSSFWKCVVKL